MYTFIYVVIIIINEWCQYVTKYNQYEQYVNKILNFKILEKLDDSIIIEH